MTGFGSKKQMAANKLWDKPSVAFDEWWNNDYDESTNPFWLGSDAYWAWAGWKAALAQTAQEPAFGWIKQSELARAKLYSGSVNLWLEKHDCDFPLYTAPPQRTWVGLNEKERNDIEDDFYANISIHVFDAIEAKLKEKNNGA